MRRREKRYKDVMLESSMFIALEKSSIRDIDNSLQGAAADFSAHNLIYNRLVSFSLGRKNAQ